VRLFIDGRTFLFCVYKHETEIEMRDCGSDRSQQKYWQLALVHRNNKSLGLVIEVYFFFIVTLSSQKFPSTEEACQTLRSLKFCEHEDTISIAV
jgi:hypothetical protein